MNKVALFLVLLATACTTPTPIGTPSPGYRPSPTIPLPLTSTPSRVGATSTEAQELISGTVTIKVNVRSGPSTSFASLGQLEAGQTIQILVRDSTGSWVQILYPAGPQGRGWVALQYISGVGGTLIPLDATPTPTGPSGSVIQRLNVRSGPGRNFDTLGMLDPDQVVYLTGKNTTASWFQIIYPSGPGGHAWVTAQYIQTDASPGLPVLDDYGKVVTPGASGTESGPVASLTPTIGPAYADGDSASNPAVRITFSATGADRFTYSDEVSTPQGDGADWIEFTPFSATGGTARILLSLACTGNSALNVELWQSGAPLTGWGSLACGETDQIIHLAGGQVYQLHLFPTAGTGLQFVAYTLTVQNSP